MKNCCQNQEMKSCCQNQDKCCENECSKKECIEDSCECCFEEIEEDFIEDIDYFCQNDFKKGTKNSLGYDIYSNQSVTLKYLKPQLVSTSLRINFKNNRGIHAFICSRSGLATKGIFVLNSPGIIDNDYTGEIKIILLSVNKEDINIDKNSRIAQCIFVREVDTNMNLVSEKDIEKNKTERQNKGFGHTGLK